MIVHENMPRRVLQWAAVWISTLALVVLAGWSQSNRAADAPASSAPTPAATPAPSLPPPGAAPAAAPNAPAPPAAPAAKPAAKPADASAAGKKEASAAPSKTVIKVFRLKKQDPAEMIETVTGLMTLARSSRQFNAGELSVMAVLKKKPSAPTANVDAAPQPLPTPGASPMAGGLGPGGGYGIGGPAPGMMGGFPGMPMGMPGEGGMMGAGGGMMPGMVGPLSEAAGDFRLAVDEPTRSIIARGTTQAIEQIEKLITALDTANSEWPDRIGNLDHVRLVRFTHRNVFDLLNVLSSLGVPIQINYVPREAAQELQTLYRSEPGGTLIVIGPEDQLNGVVELVRSLDVKQTASPENGATPAPG